MGSEDFGLFLQHVPGNFVFIGNGDSLPLHNAGYVFDDAMLPIGAEYLANLVLMSRL